MVPWDLTTITARRICVIKPTALGDVVQTLPLLPALRERFRSAHIAWVISDGLADLLTGHPHLDEIILFRRGGSPRVLWQLLRELQEKQFDLVLDLQGLLRTAAMTWSTRAPRRIGLETAREAAHLACHLSLPDTGRNVPAHQRYWRVAEALGVGELEQRTIVSVPPDVAKWADGLARELEHPPASVHPGRSPILAVNAGARWPTKRWPPEKFATIAAKAVRLYGFSTVIVGGRDDMPLAAQIKHLIERFCPSATVMNLAGRTSIKELAAVLERSDILLTNDSGPMHLAAGLGTPVLGVFLCTSPTISGPPGDRHMLVATNISCAARYKKRCPYSGRKHLACMDELSTERVWQQFMLLVQRHKLVKRAA